MFSNSFLNGIARIYQWIISFCSKFQSIFIFLLRLIWGHQFFLTGLGKFRHHHSVAQFFESLHIPAPAFTSYFIAGLELVGGILLIAGLASRLISIPLVISMFVAYGTAHVSAFSSLAFIWDPSIIVREAPFAFLLTTLIVLIFGPGKISLDGWLKRILKNRPGL